MSSCNTYHLTWVSLTLGMGYLHGCSSKAQPLLLTLDKGYLLTAAVPDLKRGIAPLGPPAPGQPLLLGMLLPAAGPGLGLGVAPQGHRPWPQVRGGFSRPPLTSDAGCFLLSAPDLGRRVAPLGPPVPAQPLLLGLLLPAAGPGLGHGWLLRVTAPGLGCKVASPGRP